MDERAIMEASAAGRKSLLAASYLRLTGAPLVPTGQDLWSAPIAVVAHGTEPNPLFFYANWLALDTFRMAAAQFITMESRLSAGPADRDERAAMLARLEAADVVHGYRGVRVAGDGGRFLMEDAVIWNLLDDAGQRHGQAAAFARWKPLS